jgi:hypothetical protein
MSDRPGRGFRRATGEAEGPRVRLRGLAYQLRQQRFEGAIRDVAHLLVAAVLDGMFDVDRGRIGANRAGLGLGTVRELDGSDKDSGHTLGLEVHRVVHTARRAAASVGQGLHDGAALGGDLSAQVGGSGLGEGGLAVAPDLRAARLELLGETIEEEVAAGLGDVEQPDGLAFEAREPRESLAYGEAALRGGVEQDSLVLLLVHVYRVRPPQ